MLGRAFAVTAVLLLAGLAGCIGKDNGPEDAPVENTTTAGVVNAEEASKAPDGRGEISAFKETNRTETSGIGAMNHTHDYWAGQTRKHVADIGVSLIPFPLAPCKKEGGGCTAGSTAINTDTYPVGTAIADFDIPRPDPSQDIGGLIFEGTAQLELLPNYIQFQGAADHPNAKVFFDYLTTADEPGAFRQGGELKAGTPFILPVQPTEADMPHQTKSLWVLRVYSDSTTVAFDMNLTLTAVKGNAIVNWPPHPDLYAEKQERTVFEGPVHLESKGTIDANLFGSDAGWLHPERILSYGTERVEVTVTGVTVTTDVPGVPVAGYVLEYHNASKTPLLGNGAQYGGRLTDEGSDGQTWTFVIDITNDPDSFDTPYGDKSRWGFRFVPQFDNGGAACYDEGGLGQFAQQILVGCQFVPWKMDYTMVVKAYGHSTATESLPDAAAPTAPTSA